MKLEVLSSSKKYYNNITVFQLQHIDVPLSQVLSSTLINFTSKPLFKIYNRNTEEYYSNSKEDLLLYDITLKNEGKKKGIITYSDTEKLAEFLLENYIPKGSYIIDKILKETTKLTKNKRKQLIIDLIIRHRESMLKNNTSNFFGSKYFAKSEILEEQNSLFAPIYHEYDFLKLLEYKRNFILEHNQQEIVIMKKTEHKTNIKILNKHSSGITTTKRMLIKPNAAKVVFYYDGFSTYILYITNKLIEPTLISLLSKPVYEEFNTYGLATETDRECLIPEEFYPLFVLRVPAYCEVKDQIEKIYDYEYLQVIKEFPATLLVYDTRSNLKLNEKIKIIDDTKVSLSLLSHVVDWMYSPKNNPNIYNLYKFLEEEPYYVAFGTII
ncbi:MAG: hypothetical protein NZ928_04925 [Endomicrobia bacterium]|nr:hypothetical protein [Endomicrobiia bacterium]MDW8056126.1 hypothetical protein [Elusimicrobiota bacterium]